MALSEFNDAGQQEPTNAASSDYMYLVYLNIDSMFIFCLTAQNVLFGRDAV